MKRTSPAFFLLLLLARPALGCDCVENPQFSAPLWVRESAAVFLGRVTSIDLEGEPISLPTGHAGKVQQFSVGRALVQLTVIEAWKGVATPAVELITGAAGSDCGFRFEIGQEYLVFADRPGLFSRDQLNVTLCSGTAEKGQAWTKLRKLRQWRRPQRLG